MSSVRRLVLTLVLATPVLLTAGCEDEDPRTPPTLHLGQDVCVACSMIVSDERYASGLVVERDGRVEKYAFDDVGEMLELTLEDLGFEDATSALWFVKDAATLEWIAAGEAFYVKSAELHTPMGFGVAAYASESDAQAAAQRTQGVVLRRDDLRGG